MATRKWSQIMGLEIYPRKLWKRHKEKMLAVGIDYLKGEHIFLGELSLKSSVYVHLFPLSQNLNIINTSSKYGSPSNICLLTWTGCPFEKQQFSNLRTHMKHLRNFQNAVSDCHSHKDSDSGSVRWAWKPVAVSPLRKADITLTDRDRERSHRKFRKHDQVHSRLDPLHRSYNCD